MAVGGRRRLMSGRRVFKSLQAVAAHALLCAFTLLLVLKLDHYVRYSWWMCRSLMPADEEIMSDEAIWESLPHFWVAISMIFFIAATTFTLLKLCGDVAALGWWDLFINYGVAECFAFLICTKWYNPAIHQHSLIARAGSSSSNIRSFNWNSSLLLSSEEGQQSRICSLQDIGGHVMKIPLIGFQGTPRSAREIPIFLLFAPILLLQAVGLLFSIYRFLEKLVLFLRNEADTGAQFGIPRSVRDCLGFMHRGSRLLGWWSIDEGSQEELARLYYAGQSGYNTFSPDTVKKMPKAELAQEIWKLQAALSEQTEITNFTREEYERLQNEKILCRICFEEEISIVLLPCRHHILCSTCCEKCKRCPICRVFIEERLPVHDV